MAHMNQRPVVNDDENSESGIISTFRRVFTIPTETSCMNTSKKRWIWLFIIIFVLIAIIVVPTTIVLTKKTSSSTTNTTAATRINMTLITTVSNEVTTMKIGTESTTKTTTTTTTTTTTAWTSAMISTSVIDFEMNINASTITDELSTIRTEELSTNTK